jgi:hypothetical protein
VEIWRCVISALRLGLRYDSLSHRQLLASVYRLLSSQQLIFCTLRLRLVKRWISTLSALCHVLPKYSLEDIIFGRTRIARAGLEGGKFVVAYGMHALVIPANLIAHVGIHLLLVLLFLNI